MQKEIQLTDKTLLVVGLPEEALQIRTTKIGIAYGEYYGNSYGERSITLPKGDWRLLGIYPELTEEQAGTIGLDLERLITLMDVNKIWTVNPYGEEKPIPCYDVLWDQEGDDLLEQWQDAEQRTFSKYAILIK